MPLESDIRKAAYGGETMRQQIARAIGRLLGRHRLAQRLFLGPDGAPTPAAAEWLAQLATDNFVNGGGFDPDARQTAYNLGRRDLALDILRDVNLDLARLDQLHRLERENDHD